jgi:hypothetical protein
MTSRPVASLAPVRQRLLKQALAHDHAAARRDRVGVPGRNRSSQPRGFKRVGRRSEYAM